MANFGRLDGNPHYELTTRGRRQSRLFLRICGKKMVTFALTLYRRYTAACCPLNAACRSLKPRDGSFWRNGVGILCRRIDLQLRHSCSSYANRTVPRIRREAGSVERVAGGSVVWVCRAHPRAGRQSSSSGRTWP
jgi:hypothetical protein